MKKMVYLILDFATWCKCIATLLTFQCVFLNIGTHQSWKVLNLSPASTLHWISCLASNSENMTHKNNPIS